MGTQNILTIWQTCKTLIGQAETYANSGYSRIKDQTGISKINKYMKTNEPEGETALTTNNVPKDILNAIHDNFSKVLEFVQLYLLQQDTAAFYGLMLIDMELDINYSQRGVIDINVKSHPIKISYNPFFAKNYSLNELLGATINEIMKIVYMHPVSYAKLNREKDAKKHSDLEVASSVSSTELVYRDVKYDGEKNRVKLNSDTYTKSDLEEEISNETGGRYLNSTSPLEYYYQVAQAYRKNYSGSGNGGGKSSGSGGGSSNSVATPDNNQGNDIHDWEDMNNPNDVQEELKDVINEAYNNLSDKQRGLMPNTMIQQIEALFKKPEIDWKALVRKYVGIIPSGHRPSRLRLNRRQPDRFDLSGQLSDKIVRLVVAIDTSGSMSEKDIAYVMNEIFNIVKDCKSDVTVIECDAEIGKIYHPKTVNEVQTKVSGRGGTSFVPVIDYINSHKYRDAVLIYFTDGYGDYEIERPRTYRNLWVVLDDAKNLSLKNPYGEVKSLKGDKDYTSKFNK